MSVMPKSASSSSGLSSASGSASKTLPQLPTTRVPSPTFPTWAELAKLPQLPTVEQLAALPTLQEMATQGPAKPTPPAGPFLSIYGGRPEALLDVLSRVPDVSPALLQILIELQSGRRKFENLPAAVQAQIHDIATQVASIPGPPPRRYPRARKRAPGAAAQKKTGDAEAPPAPAAPLPDLPPFWWEDSAEKPTTGT